jgi:hypothetical protein
MDHQDFQSSLNGYPYRVLIVGLYDALTHPDDLNAPLSSQDDPGLSYFGEIRSAGALDWGHRPH